MVKVRGQMDQPIVDIAQVQEEYWERRTFELPSLAHLHKPTGWRKYLPWQKTQTPVVILRRLKADDWAEFDERFYNLKADLARDMPTYRKIVDKMMSVEELTKEETATLAEANKRATPMYIAMLEQMIEKPKLDYDQIKILLDTLDEYDRNTLLGQVNTLTSQRMSVANKIGQERMAEVQKMQEDTFAKYGR
tara:strand:+ start:53 stop:628 length:576 start_codon:yes stop_codon:yes gene_type:complete